MASKKRFDLNILLIILISGILRILPYFQNITYRFRTDDFGPLTYPAYLAGYDWTSYVKGMEHYYGFGYYWIMTPLFRLTSSPEALMVGVQVVNSVTLIGIALLIYHIQVHYFHMKRSWTTAVMAIVPSLFGGAIWGRNMMWFHTDNEIPLLLAIWLTVWALLAAERVMTKGLGRRVFHAVLVSVILSWMLSVHERSMALFIAVAIVEVLLFLIKRKWLLQPAAFFGSLAGGYYLQRMVRHAVITTMWQGGWPGKNTNAFRDVGLWFLESKQALTAFLMTLFGNVHSIIVKGFGITAIAIVLLVVWLVWNIFPKLRAKLPKEEQEWIDREMLMILIFGTCIAITVAGLAMRWGVKLVPGLSDYTNSLGFKGICYGRYYQSYLSPVVVAAMALICRKKPAPFARSMAEGWWGLYAAAEVIFFSLIYYHLLKAREVAGVDYYTRAYSMRLFDEHGPSFYAILTTVITTMALTFMTIAAVNGDRVVCRTKRHRLTGRHFVTVAALFLLVLFGIDRFDEVKTTHPSLEFYEVEGMDDVLARLENDDALPANLYMPSTNWCFSVQIDRKNLEFQAGVPAGEQLAEDNLVITSTQQDIYLQAGYAGYQVGSHWIYTNVEETAGALDDCEMALAFDKTALGQYGMDQAALDAAVAEQAAAEAAASVQDGEEKEAA